MFSKKFFITVLLAITALTEAAPGINKREEGVYQLDFAAKKGPKTTKTGISGSFKASTENIPLGNEGYFYVAELYFGSNKQKIGVDIDTGSSDLWVFDSSIGGKNTLGAFNRSQSTTDVDTDLTFQIFYGGGTSTQGNYSIDDVSLGPDGPTLKKFQFGVATQASDGQDFGIFGVGFPSLEAAQQQYDNFPIALRKQGFINKAAYSLYLNDIDAKTGSILFGGIDNAKYSGDLVKVPFISNDYFEVAFESISLTGYSSVGFNGILDSGTTYTFIPPSVLQGLVVAVGAKYASDNSGGYYYFDSADDAPESLNFDLNGVSITVPRDDLIQSLTDDQGNPIDRVAFSIFPGGDTAVVGDNILRHAYIVYNVDDKYAQLAPVKYTSDSSITTIE